MDVNIRWQVREEVATFHYLALSGEEGKDVARLFAQCTTDGCCCVGHAGRVIGIGRADYLYVIGAALAFNQRSVETPAYIISVDGGRHNYNLEVRAYQSLGFESQGVCDVGV